MNEGALIKMYVKREHLEEADVAAAINVSEQELQKIYQDQTVEPAVKHKLQSYLKRDIFDGSLLTDYYNDVPDQKANKPED